MNKSNPLPELSADQLPGGNRKGKDAAPLVLMLLGLVVVPLLYTTDNIDIVEVNKLGRYLCFAIVAVSLDLIWGYTGMLCLCQSLFFALGGYAMGMYLAHHGGPEGVIDVTGWKIPACLHIVYPERVGETEKDWLVPFFWKPFYWLEFSTILSLLIPGFVALVIGFFVFRSRVRGVFFAILTQALTLAVWLVFSMNKMKLCGTNGMNRFERVGPFFDPEQNSGLVKLFCVLFLFLAINLFLLTRSIVKWYHPSRRSGDHLSDKRRFWRDPWQLIPLGLSVFAALCAAGWIRSYVAGNFEAFDKLEDDGVKFILYLVTVAVLLDVYLLCRYIIHSRLGRVLVAIRDKESRLRFSGYRPYVYKVFIFSVSAMIAGLGGMLYAPQMGIFTPTNLEPKESILVVIYVAVGGRGSLSGPIIGALAVNLIYSYLTSVAADTWPFVQGALFVAVVLARPDGLISLKKDFHWFLRALRGYLNFHGRSGRQEFWYFTVFHLVFVLLLTSAAMLVDPRDFTQIFTGGQDMKTITMVFSWILLAYLVLMLVPFLAVSVRRIQDTGRAPWWLLVGALPLTAWLVFPLLNLNLGATFNLVAVTGSLALLGLMSLRGTPEANKYGEVPEIAELAGSGEDVAQEDEDGEDTGRVDVESRLKRVANIQRLRGDKPQIEANILSVHDLTVVFDGFKALDITEFTLPHYMLQVIIGPNGAGKTTLCDIISGKTRPTTGRVIFSGRDITEMSETDIALMGVGRKFQTPTIYDSLTVYQNMELALPDSQGLAHNLWHSTSREEHDRIFEMLRRVRLEDDAYRLVQALSHGQRQWLEISMLILSSPKLLLVDEPAAGLTDEETILTAELLLELQEEHSIIVIEHDMDFVRLLNAPVTVLNEGLIMAQGSMEEVQADEKVVEAYLGR
jgi:urea transport system ATP-binding protein